MVPYKKTIPKSPKSAKYIFLLNILLVPDIFYELKIISKNTIDVPHIEISAYSTQCYRCRHIGYTKLQIHQNKINTKRLQAARIRKKKQKRNWGFFQETISLDRIPEKFSLIQRHKKRPPFNKVASIFILSINYLSSITARRLRLYGATSFTPPTPLTSILERSTPRLTSSSATA